MNPLQHVEGPEFIARYAAAASATARGEAPPFLFAIRWRPGGLACLLDTGAGPIGAKILGDFEPLEPLTGYYEQDTCLRIVCFGIDQWWQEFDARRRARDPVGIEDLPFHLKWGAVRDLYKPAIYDDGPWPDGSHVSELWADAECEVMQGLVLAFPKIAKAFCRPRYRNSNNPRLAKVVDLALAMTRKATKH